MGLDQYNWIFLRITSTILPMPERWQSFHSAIEAQLKTLYLECCSHNDLKWQFSQRLFIQRKINRRTQPCPFCLIVAVSEKNLNLMRTFHWPFNLCKMKMLSPSNRFILDKFALCRTTAVFNCLQLILLDWESNQGPLAPQPSINCATETL